MRPESFSLNPYEVLGVSPNASNEEIRAAYRQHALRWHPDRNPNDDYAMRMMQRVNAAWTILKDEDSRAAYDRWQGGEANTRSGPDAWEQPASGPSPGGEWYRPPPPPPSSAACPRCQRFNESGSVYCYSCGYPLDEASNQSNSDGYRTGSEADEVSVIDRPGGFWVRLVAYFVDITIVLIAALAIVRIIGIDVYDLRTLQDFLAGDHDLIRMVLWVLYFTASVKIWSRTLGKWIFGLRVVRNDGSRVGIGRAFARTLCYYASLILIGIGFLMIAFRKDKRGLHDLICDTKVVYR